MIRRNFFRHLTATAAGLLIADDALAMLVEPRRKVWPGWTAAPEARWVGNVLEVPEELLRPIPEGGPVLEYRSEWYLNGAVLNPKHRELFDASLRYWRVLLPHP